MELITRYKGHGQSTNPQSRLFDPLSMAAQVFSVRLPALYLATAGLGRCGRWTLTSFTSREFFHYMHNIYIYIYCNCIPVMCVRTLPRYFFILIKHHVGSNMFTHCGTACVSGREPLAFPLDPSDPRSRISPPVHFSKSSGAFFMVLFMGTGCFSSSAICSRNTRFSPSRPKHAWRYAWRSAKRYGWAPCTVFERPHLVPL